MKHLVNLRCRKIFIFLIILSTVGLLFGCTLAPPTPADLHLNGSNTVIPSKTKPNLQYPTFTPSPTAEPDLVVVDATRLLGEVSPYVYGTNIGPWQNIGQKEIARFQEAGFTIFRYPGGNYVDEYAPSQSGLDEFINICRQVGAEPMVEVKLFHSTPEAAVKLLTYANVTRGYGIRYWSIGNEPSLYWGKRKESGYDTARFNADWREYALAMKAVDPTILLLGPETHQYTGLAGDPVVDIHYKDWMNEFLLTNGDLVDIVSFHRYSFGNYDPFTNELLRSSAEWDIIIPNLRRLIQETTSRDLPIAITEVNSNWSNRSRGETTPDTLLNAIWWADALGRMIQQRVFIINQFAADGEGGWSLLGSQEPRPAYYDYLIYKEFGNRLVFSSSGIKNVSIYAAIRTDGALSMILVNRNTEGTHINVDLRHFVPANNAKRVVLDNEHLADEIPSNKINNQFSTELPGISVTLIIIPTGN